MMKILLISSTLFLLLHYPRNTIPVNRLPPCNLIPTPPAISTLDPPWSKASISTNTIASTCHLNIWTSSKCLIMCSITTCRLPFPPMPRQFPSVSPSPRLSTSRRNFKSHHQCTLVHSCMKSFDLLSSLLTAMAAVTMMRWRRTTTSGFLLPIFN